MAILVLMSINTLGQFFVEEPSGQVQHHQLDIEYGYLSLVIPSYLEYSYQDDKDTIDHGVTEIITNKAYIFFLS